MKHRPIILDEVSFSDGKLFFYADKKISNYLIRNFFADMESIVHGVDPSVNYSEEKKEGLILSPFRRIKQIKTSFYVCAYDFQVGDIMREHRADFFRSRKHPFILSFYSHLDSELEIDKEIKRHQDDLVDSSLRKISSSDCYKHLI